MITPAPCANINWQQATIETHGAKQVAVQRVLPLVVREGGEASAWGRGSADIVDQDVDAAEAIPHSADDLSPPPRPC